MLRATLALALLASPLAAQDRVVVVGGGLAEIIYALGQEHRLVGRDTTASFPPEVEELPDVGYMRALSPEGLLALDPDLILASEGAGPAETVQIMQAASVPFVQITDDPSPAAVLERVMTIAGHLDAGAQGEALVAQLEGEFAALRTEAEAVSAPKRVMFVLSAQGGRINAAGRDTGASTMIELAGGANAFDDFAGYRLLSDEAITAAAPDVILMMDRGGDHAISDAEILAHPALGLTPAAETGAVIRMNGIYLLGFGPRTAQAAQDLHRALYPDQHKGG
ncbi:heme/hemin ABC transporter substrate-binding protein [Roseinatronobacter bogoriensis]|uniref:Hemin ABC transporter substrate-binding protein n=1 Tax=Roseinatronobacter bogoriensis subsp. barguzinensis TaxID=441209 RepID=A0A2K8K837_9RHOB|nr:MULTISPECIES: ABC transporter substrate-binding protein [Rhodobaca]ATX65611.1 hemin ABC transporter substrate-binding protein [Rhodobaca barguzinensis]MBB4208455.1 iron complex transport system substrate-binding protein [Rhodobaca bogoriensis DSM 18756]TDW39097.1 iron complex transport system substrate-binding protein [Rhodobaca barguzinensis]TDY66416.1 iron complex transport system substrate-binding protein [Rhodobaca bogoriensis DSM 18756]